MMQIHELTALARQMKASDIHISEGLPLMFRIDGRLEILGSLRRIIRFAGSNTGQLVGEGFFVITVGRLRERHSDREHFRVLVFVIGVGHCLQLLGALGGRACLGLFARGLRIERGFFLLFLLLLR